MRAILVAIGLMIAGFIVSNVLAVIPLVAVGLTAATSVVIVVLSEIGYATVAIVYVRRWFNTNSFDLTVPTRHDLRWIAVGLFSALIFSRGVILLGIAIGIEPAGRIDETILGSGNPSVLLALMVISIVAIGPAEELLFRGGIQNRLGRTFGTVTAIGITSLLFVPPHAIGYVGAPAGILLNATVVFGLSVILGITYVQTENLIASMLVHGIYDAVLFGLAYMSAVGWM